MGSKVLLTDREDVAEVELEAQTEFIFMILVSSGIPEIELEQCFDQEGKLSIEGQISLRSICKKNQVTILNDLDHGVKLYIKQDHTDVLVAEWYKPFYRMRTDPLAHGSKKIFLEINLKWWSVFEENDEREKNSSTA